MLQFEKKKLLLHLINQVQKVQRDNNTTKRTDLIVRISWNENLKKVNPQNFQAFLKNSQSVLYQEFLKSSKVKKSSVP